MSQTEEQIATHGVELTDTAALRLAQGRDAEVLVFDLPGDTH